MTGTISDASPVSLIFVGLLIALAMILWIMQRKADTFDLRDAICTFTPDGKQIVSTSKSLLAGAFVVSSYYIIKSPSDMAFGAYLLAWVTNGGIAAWQKVNTQSQ